MLTNASAPAKFILCGDHFVVSGGPGVVIPATCFSTQVSLYDRPDPEVSASCVFDIEQTSMAESREVYDETASRILNDALKMLLIDLGHQGLRMVVKTTIPPAQGAGSSSALCQAIAEVLLKHYVADSIHPNYLAYFGRRLETTFHGAVSGIDNAAIAYQRPIYYQRNYINMPIAISEPTFFVAGSTGMRKGKSPYDIIREFRDNQPLVYKAECREMDAHAAHLANALAHGDLESVGEIMDSCHSILKNIGLSTPACERAIEHAKTAGALGAKITGAGAGGFVISLAPIQSVENIQRVWIQDGLTNVRCIQFFPQTAQTAG